MLRNLYLLILFVLGGLCPGLMSGENLIEVPNTGQPEHAGNGRRTEGGSTGSGADRALGKFLALLKVSVYICICFAPTFLINTSPFREPFAFAYRHLPLELYGVLISGCELTIALTMLFVFSRFIDKRPFLSYGLGSRTVFDTIKEFVSGTGVAALMVSIVMLILYLAGCYHVFSVQVNSQLVTFLPFFFVAALREE